MNMVWNGKPYYDHPPLGFWLIAGSYKLFGVGEWQTRLPSAILGLGALVLIYLVALELFKNKNIGLAAATVLGTSVWYVIRVRSGNLDVIFIFFYLLTIFLGLRSSRQPKLFPAVGISAGLLILSKTLAGSSAIVLVLLLNCRHLLKLKKTWPYLVGGIALFFLIVTPWYRLMLQQSNDFYYWHFVNIGTRRRQWQTLFDFAPAKQVLFFLHMGVRKWYYIYLVSLGWLGLRFRIFKKEVLFLLLWNFLVLFPFLSSPYTELWHLIPVFVPLSLIVSYSVFDGADFAFGTGKKVFGHLSPIKMLFNKRVQNISYLAFFLTLAAIQVEIFLPETMPKYRYESDQVKISRAVTKYKQKIYLDDDFFPIMVFYADRRIVPMFDATSWGETEDKKTLLGLFSSPEQDFVVVTRNWAPDNLKAAGIAYKLLEKNDSFSILSRVDETIN